MSGDFFDDCGTTVSLTNRVTLAVTVLYNNAAPTVSV